MFEKTDKRRLYWLIDQYLENNINAEIFHNEYYYCFSLELDYRQLTPLEERAFADLSKITGRFTHFEEDLINYPGVYYSETELKAKVKEVKDILKKET